MRKHGEGVGKRGRGGQQIWTTERDECNDVKKRVGKMDLKQDESGRDREM